MSAMRGLPAVHRILSDPRIGGFEALLGRESVKRAVNDVLQSARRTIDGNAPDYERLIDAVAGKLQDQRFTTLLPVINGTGVLLHTNLGRAPLANAAIDAVAYIARGYSNLEYDLTQGERGTRYARVASLLLAATGAEDALVVNNCAAAVLLILDTFAKGREVVVARGQLVEIGGGFRLPDVLSRSGAELVEVGATNKVYLSDYERALSPRTALLLRTHPSNFQISGFIAEVDPPELARLGRRAGIPVVEDLGSGALVDLAAYGLPHERTVQEAIGDGVDLVAFSADKVLGGPQAGIVAGKRALLARMRENPLLRALRVDKITLAALGETLRIYAAPERRNEIPFFAMLSATLDDLRARAQRYETAVPGVSIVESVAYVGGGTLAQAELHSIAISLTPAMGAAAYAAALRRRELPVVARVERDRVLLDLRTILPEQDLDAVAALKAE